MEKKQIAKGTLGVLALVSIVLATMYLTPEQIQNSYFCTATEEIGVFYGGISGTALTAYPYKENRSGFVRCIKGEMRGVWIPLKDYAKENNISIEEFLVKTQDDSFENIFNTAIVTISYNENRYECEFKNKFEGGLIESNSICKILK